jgi:hypothetical protein
MRPNESFLPRLGHWTAQVLLVFLGAYAAFWLNNYQEHQQEAGRRDQILAALENEVLGSLESAKTEGVKERQKVAEFRRALDAGEMPPIRPFAFTTDYSATDAATLLQSGGYQLLDVKTLIALRKLESTVRGGLSRITHFEKLSDELIVPNLDQDISFFYDPATKQLRKRFSEYPVILQTCVAFFNDLERADNELLGQIRAERQKH